MYEEPDKKEVKPPTGNTVYPEHSKNTLHGFSAVDRLKLAANIDSLKHLTDSSDVHVHYIDESDQRILSDIRDVYVSSSEDVMGRPSKVEKEHIAEVVARRKEPIIIDLVSSLDNIFPNGVRFSNEYATNVACIPILSTSKKDRCYLVVELIRENNRPYSQVDVKLINSATKWIALMMEQQEVRRNEERDFHLNVKLRGFIEQYFLETVNYEEFLSKILIYARNIIGATRVFFYKIPTRLNTNTNHADLFKDVVTSHKHTIVKLPEKFKFNRDMGIVSHAVKTGNTITYSTAERSTLRLDTELLKILKVSLQTCICKPLIYNGVVIAVIQLVNKKNDEIFSSADLVILDKICVYLSLVQYFEKIRELCDFEYAKCEIVRDQLGYQLTTLGTVPVYAKITNDDLPEGFHEYSWYPENQEDMLVPYCFYIFKTLCPDVSNEDSLYEFIINVKKCSRPLPYRNFMHTFDVIHTMYCLVNDIRNKLNKLEIYALMLAATCQSINSEGYVSQYYLVTNNPYTHVYEHPYFRNFQSTFSKRLIQTHRILTHFSEDEQSRLFKIFNDCLVNLNTAQGKDSIETLGIFFKANKIIELNPQHRLYKLSLIMRAVCKARVVKPFRIAKRLCENMYRELFAQGDLLKAANKTVQPWMDRANVHMIPDYEVQYIEKICLPIYDLLRQIYPSAGTLYNLCKELEKVWNLMVELRYKKAWNPDVSIGKSLEETTKKTLE